MGMVKTRFFLVSLLKRFAWMFSDQCYLKLMYRLRLGRKLNLIHPQTFTEKLQWLKLNDHCPTYSRMVDKYEMKSFVSQTLGVDCTAKTYGLWNDFDDIDWNALPDRFVLKTTHDNAGVVFCGGKASFDKEMARKKMERHLKRDFFLLTREWPYKNVKPRIMAEECLSKEGEELHDYKFLCFEGEPQLLFVAGGRDKEKFFNYYDMDFNPLPIKSRNGGVSSASICKPPCFEQMVDFAKSLSRGVPHLRVDFYCVDEKPFVGELTFFDSSGYDDMNSEEMDLKLGELIHVV